jgi:hypothetical protein
MQDGERERWRSIDMFGEPTGQKNIKVSYFEESFLYALFFFEEDTIGSVGLSRMARLR